MSRGREANTAHVVTGNTAPPGTAALPAGHPRSRAQERHGTRRRRAVGHRGHPAIPGMGQRNRAPAQPLDHRRPARHPRRDRPARSPPRSPRTRPRATSRNTPARPSTPRCAPPASPDTTSTPSSPRSPPRPSTAPGPSPASSTAASSASTSPDPGQPATWAERTPASAPAAAREIAEALDAPPRRARPPPRGQPPAVAHPTGSAYSRRTPRRCCAQTTNGAPASPRPTGKQPASPTPTRPSHPNRTTATPNSSTCGRKPSANWSIADEAAMWAGMDRGQLEAHTAAAERAQAAAPPDVSAGYGPPPTPKPTPGSKQPTPRSATTQPKQPTPAQLAGLLATERQAARSRQRRVRAWADSDPQRQGKRRQGRRRAEPPRPHPGRHTPRTVPLPCPRNSRATSSGAGNRGTGLTPDQAPARRGTTDNPGMAAPVRSGHGRRRALYRARAPGRHRRGPAMAPSTPATGRRRPRNHARDRAARARSQPRNTTTRPHASPKRSPTLNRQRGSSPTNRPAGRPAANTPRASAGKPKPSPKRTPPWRPRPPPTPRWSCECRGTCRSWSCIAAASECVTTRPPSASAPGCQAMCPRGPWPAPCCRTRR